MTDDQPDGWWDKINATTHERSEATGWIDPPGPHTPELTEALNHLYAMYRRLDELLLHIWLR
ncbi:MAG: hypothetical protein OXI12_13965 [Gammaproteobacteria bacterium]|nr:hypothetical protein [Gammaproteobacteria bacterium]